jgi:hypothetical protein
MIQALNLSLKACTFHYARRDRSNAQFRTAAFAEGSQGIEFAVTYDFFRVSELAAWRVVGGDYRLRHFLRLISLPSPL